MVRERGGECLSRRYHGNTMKLIWMCIKGHVWTTTPKSIKKNTWCPVCAGKMPLKLNEYRSLAIRKEGNLLSLYYKNIKTKLVWKCTEGHVWASIPNNVRRGSWCPKCSGNTRLGLELMQEIAVSKGGRCLSKKYKNGRTKLTWECAKKHIWRSTPKDIKAGRWCPYCAENKKFTLKEMKTYAIRQEGEYISGWEEREKSTDKLKWRCKEGHLFEATCGEVRRGKWCNICRIKYTPPFQEMQDLAWERNGICLSINYRNIIQEEYWKCKKGHVWQASLKIVRGGNWCPICNDNKQKNIKDMRNMASELDGDCLSIQYVTTTTKLIWTCSKNHVWETNPHNIVSKNWCPICAGNIKQNIFKMIELAQKRSGYCVSQVYRGNKEVLTWICAKGHLWETFPTRLYGKTWCPICGGKKKNTIENMQSLAKNNNGSCLSSNFHSDKNKLAWKCKHGHVFKSRPSSIKRGIWCPVCGKSLKKTIQEIRAVAENRDGQCISREYRGTSVELTWICAEGHSWESNPSNVVYSESWCPKCAGNVKHTITKMIKLANKNRGFCLSSNYVSNHFKLTWKCEVGHVWKAVPQNVMKGSWCPACGGKRTYNLNHLYQLAESKKGKCLSGKFRDNKTILIWKCEKGHVWKNTAGHILRGLWCPYCSKKRLTIDRMRNIAKERIGNCLSKKYYNNRTQLVWICKVGHVWRASPGNVKKKTWCPFCSRKKNRS